jgi:hypothetical protein
MLMREEPVQDLQVAFRSAHYGLSVGTIRGRSGKRMGRIEGIPTHWINFPLQ